MIELLGVSKGYKLRGVRKKIIDNVNFKFPERRNIAIMGENGAGKSTLIRMIAGAELPDRGRIVRSEKISWPLGFSGAFNGTMTGIENIRFVSRIYGKDTEEVIDYVREFSELGPSLNLPIKTYSSGMKARLSFGLSLAIDFEYYLVDEIIAVGDRKFKKKSREAFKSKLANSNVLLATHSSSSAKIFCDCGILLRDKKIQYYDSVKELLVDYRKYC